jgi:hypothetical protein
LAGGDFGPGDDEKTFLSQAKWPAVPFCAGLREEEVATENWSSGAGESPEYWSRYLGAWGSKRPVFRQNYRVFPAHKWAKSDKPFDLCSKNRAIITVFNRALFGDPPKITPPPNFAKFRKNSPRENRHPEKLGVFSHSLIFHAK